MEGVREIKEQFLGLSGCYGNAMTPMAAYEIKSCLILLLIACAGATPFPAMWVQRLKNASMWKSQDGCYKSCYILTGLVLATAFLLGSSVHPFYISGLVRVSGKPHSSDTGSLMRRAEAWIGRKK